MAIKRALVVDDSKSARIALKKLLEEQQLEVALAESGEAAIEFLKRDLVDVIFMDHTMPGMDGLEAVTAIKANPRTATIPVMMYTTKEGEVYVGQARALGAVGVLPKNVQPHQLFEMLQKLDLVRDRRVGDRRRSDAATVPDEHEVDRAYDQQAVGMSVQALVTRILQDQHNSLRSDVLRSQKSFARDVAAEIIREHDRRIALDEETAETEEAGEDPTPVARGKGWAMAASALLVVASILGWQFKEQRDGLLAQVDVLERDRVRAEFDNAQSFEVSAELHAVREENRALREAAVQALVWAANQGNQHDAGEDAFSEALAGKLHSLVEQLRSIGFAGELRLTSHLGEFCLEPDEFGELQLAAPDTPVAQCSELGNPLAGSPYVSDRLSVPFAQLVRVEERRGIEFDLVALDLGTSQAARQYPAASANADSWNEAALYNNRVEIEVAN